MKLVANGDNILCLKPFIQDILTVFCSVIPVRFSRAFRWMSSGHSSDRSSATEHAEQGEEKAKQDGEEDGHVGQDNDDDDDDGKGT